MAEKREQESKNAIESVIRDYFKGYTAAEGELIARAFHPETRLYSVDVDAGDVLERTDLPAWLENLAARKSKGDIRQADLQIPLIDVSGPAAVAKVVLTFARLRFTDYLSLLRIEKSWRIVGKIYIADALE